MAWAEPNLDINNLQEKAKSICNAASLEAFRLQYLGRKGILKEAYSCLKEAPAEQKAIIGQKINQFKVEIEKIIAQKKNEFSGQGKESKSNIDITLPGVYRETGHAHLLTQTIDEICDIFEKLGFMAYEGPELETEFNNFDALNVPANHPSRDSFDTYYVDQKDPINKDRNLLLRCHTSPGQIRIMKEIKPPLAVIIPGKVYRPDAVDASHSFMFHQIEGLLVDKEIKFSDLKGLLTVFCKKLFGEDIKMRFRPHFFPFTEPSAEIDISWKEGKKDWLEIMGCGMVHPNVFDAVGYPKGKYTGLAFGMGVERMAMLKYGIKDIRLFYENDARFLKQF